ncbi:hypothetical protein T265_03724 [Opisthorchis viverrini]|uniref:Reverse transcriptase RNase H-like domain-containing protein n=1 Tax=Opisthorchis viverrini TaxID=6198 RepID=A0A074ZV52_OPIVI|nr:hypothetical protein T265_03724 [Opisthorchis viverrini]KER29707.1 hypothetical protein T265_03724 [Opisthorchis viverrini]
MLVHELAVEILKFRVIYTFAADASDRGISAVRKQKNGFITYASRVPANAKQTYLSIEKEFLAITFAQDKLAQYLLGQLEPPATTSGKVGDSNLGKGNEHVEIAKPAGKEMQTDQQPRDQKPINSPELPIFQQITNYFGRSTLKTARLWETFACRQAYTRQQLYFLHECLRKHIFPRSVTYRPPINHPQDWVIARQNGRRMVRLMITDAHNRIRKYERIANGHREACLRKIGPDLMEQLSMAVERRVSSTAKNKKAHLDS